MITNDLITISIIASFQIFEKSKELGDKKSTCIDSAVKKKKSISLLHLCYESQEVFNKAF